MGDVAIVQGVDEEVTSVDSKDTSGKWAFKDVFQRRGRRLGGGGEPYQRDQADG